MRLALSILALIIYLVVFNAYVLNLPNPEIAKETKKLWYAYDTGLILLYYTIDSWNGYKTWLRELIGRFTIICVICNFLLIILTHHTILSQPIIQIVAYNSFCILICVLVFISSWKNGLFK